MKKQAVFSEVIATFLGKCIKQVERNVIALYKARWFTKQVQGMGALFVSESDSVRKKLA